MTCAALIREGKARIITVTRKDGSTYRYTKIKKPQRAQDGKEGTG